jgi:hypothetical protein
MKARATLGLLFSACTALGFGTENVEPALLTAQDIGQRLRVFATPGDYKLQNSEATAAIRRQDGWLTEFWPNRVRLPSTPQLGTTSDIDGIWQVHPVLYVSQKEAYPFVARRVSLRADGIETEGYTRVGAVVYQARTLYQLARDTRKLRISTTFSLDGKRAPKALGAGHAIKWGNVSYYLDTAPSPKLAHKGPATWIGRRGAAGDLLFRARQGARLWVEHKARLPGFQGTIYALSAAPNRDAPRAGVPLTVDCELSYETLPLPARAPVPDTGTLALAVSDENAAPLPAKVRIERVGQRTALFDADGGLDGADRFMWTGNGKLERSLAPGAYQLFVTSGIERDAASLSVDIRGGSRLVRDVRLPRVIATPGVISADLHLHQAPSVDADVSLPARVVSVAAEGVELAVATDHYVVTDLEPIVRALQSEGVLTAELATWIGTEVSTLGHRFGHFNVFPLEAHQNVRYRDTTVDELFADARRQVQSGIVQVNHPRLEPNLGYFTYFGIDDETGLMSRPGFNRNFDTLEVYNGDDAYEIKAVRRVFVDWLHLLGLGERWPATGSSDSHKLAFLDPGLPRTLIRHAESGTDAEDVLAPRERILAALKAGRSQVTSGPIITADVNGKQPGERLTEAGSSVALQVRVQAAPWISVSNIEVYVGGSGTPERVIPVPRSRSVLRYDGALKLPLRGKTFVVIAVSGTEPLPNASRRTLPFAFTNPIWIEP